MLERDSLIPLYEQVEAIIKENILKEVWSKGSKIPTEPELMKELGVSRGTLKRAISSLQQKGYLVQKQGLGTFVHTDIEIPLAEGLYSFSEYFYANNIDFENIILLEKIQYADENIASKLDISVGSAYLCLRRLRKVDGEAVMLIENNINIENAPQIENADFTKESLFSIIEKYSKQTVVSSETKYAAVAADMEISNYFKIKEGGPILYQEQVVHLHSNKIIEFAKVWIKSNHFSLGTILYRKQGNA
ncbi:GntR family transcriptional regulator [Enterococcus sp. RIT-PI-f]|uniref:GntR family transcriptional regulator n=1 Tax=Enterococcus sp. RIT-PI-f TaxID=1690244 RepID=UPI0006B92416|nr:GntR family transcriptional regulator [Enterococcus sp. RIT-PI-f]KPG68485.1 hypothetical protein AEQ18_14560 [Enterococcus sp. RIT-PI-f]